MGATWQVQSVSPGIANAEEAGATMSVHPHRQLAAPEQLGLGQGPVSALTGGTTRDLLGREERLRDGLVVFAREHLRTPDILTSSGC